MTVRRLAIRLFAFLLLSISGSAFGEPLSLSDAIEKAKSQSLAGKRAALKAESARIDIEIAQKGDDPTLTVSSAFGSRWTRREDGARETSISRIHTYGARLGATLYDFGRQSAKEEAAQYRAKLEEISKEEVEEALFWSVIRGYHSVVAAERLLVIAKEQLELSESKLKQQRASYKQGLKPESDVVTAEVDVSRARLAKQDAIDVVRRAKLDLTQLVNPGHSDTEEFKVSLSGISTDNPGAWEKLAGELLQEAGSARPVMKRLTVASEALNAEETAVTATLYPELTASASYDWTNQPTADWSPLRPQASGQIGITWLLPWNGMTSLSRSQIARDRLDVELEVQTELRRQAELAAESRLVIEQAKSRYDALRAQLELVKKQSGLVDARYKAGLASALEVSTAEAAVLNAKLELLRLANNVATGLIALAESRGVRDVGLLAKL